MNVIDHIDNDKADEDKTPQLQVQGSERQSAVWLFNMNAMPIRVSDCSALITRNLLAGHGGYLSTYRLTEKEAIQAKRKHHVVRIESDEQIVNALDARYDEIEAAEVESEKADQESFDRRTKDAKCVRKLSDYESANQKFVD